MLDNETPMIEFSAQDRCDRCIGRAYTLAKHEDFGELLFCPHHSRKVRQALFDEGWTIIDDTLGLEELGYSQLELV